MFINLIQKDTFYFSDWNYSFPNNIEYIEFIPSSPYSKNVSVYGQNYDTPILNISNRNYAGLMNFSVYLNESYSCVDLKIGITGFVNESVSFTNNSWIELVSDLSVDSNFGLWMWADYNCTYYNWRLWDPSFSFRACYAGADLCGLEVS
jgi:hypothetical protein